MSTGGRGRCAVRGTITASRRLNSSTLRVTRSSVQRRIRMSRLRSNCRPRCLNGTPTASNSRAYQPAATPSTRRPPEITSRLPRVLAATTGLRSGSTRTPVPSLIVRVRAATAPSMVMESTMGNEGSTPSSTWSQAQSDSKPRASARSEYAYRPWMSGTSPGPTKLRMAKPKSVMGPLADELALGVEHTEDGELLVGRRRGRGEGGAHENLEAGVLANLLDRRARVQGQELHAPTLRVEAEEAERGDNAGDAAEEQAVLAAGVAAVEVARARHEVDALGEAALLVDGE